MAEAHISVKKNPQSGQGKYGEKTDAYWNAT